MILSDRDLLPLLTADPALLTPAMLQKETRAGMSYGLSSAGYDVRCVLGKVGGNTLSTTRLRPGDFCLVATLERFHMPDNVLGVVHDKSTWARRGLAVQNTVIEPGWRGYLTLELTNHGIETLLLEDGYPIAQVLFHALSSTPVAPYDGKYQDQAWGPQRARMGDDVPMPRNKAYKGLI